MPELNAGCSVFVPGIIEMVGMAHNNSEICIQNGNHRLWLMVKDAIVGPRKETT
jgi:predicted ribosome-associated RNA-binding protein Tma20